MRIRNPRWVPQTKWPLILATILVAGLATYLASCQEEPIEPVFLEDYFRFDAFYPGTPDVRLELDWIDSIDAPVAEEGRSFRIRIARSDSSSEASVRLDLVGEGATEGEDFRSPTQPEVTFAEGQSSRLFDFSVLEDSIVEGSESVRLTLTSLTRGHGVVGPDLVVELVDNEPPDIVGDIHVPLAIGNRWRYVGYGHQWFDGQKSPIRRELTVEVVDEYESEGVTYAVLTSGYSPTGLDRELWAQDGQSLLRTFERSPFEGLPLGLDDAYRERFLRSLPWRWIDFEDGPENRWTHFAADTVVLGDEAALSYDWGSEDLGRTSVVTPAGRFLGVQIAHDDYTYDTSYITHPQAQTSRKNRLFVADSVGVVRFTENSQWYYRSEGGGGPGGGRRRVEYQLVEYTIDGTVH